MALAFCHCDVSTGGCFGRLFIRLNEKYIPSIPPENKDLASKLFRSDFCVIAMLPRRFVGSILEMRTEKLTGLSGVFAFDFFNRIQEVGAESKWLVKA